jgi:ABC-type transport system involved in cytochrome bd biosynthesis fused ATPase/permease subunit
MHLDNWIAMIGIVATIPVYKGWFIEAIKKNKAWRIQTLKKQIHHLTSLHQDNFYYNRWATESIVIILAILSVAFMFEGVAFTPDGQPISSIFISLLSTLAYLVCIHKIRIFSELKAFEKTLERLNKKLTKLNS